MLKAAGFGSMSRDMSKSRRSVNRNVEQVVEQFSLPLM